MRIILFVLFSFTTFHLFSQDSLLKKFKYRIDRYQAINFNVGGSGQLYNTDYVTGSNNNHGFGGNFGGNYNLIRSTDRILLNVSGGFSTNFNSNKAESSSNNSKSRNLNLYPSINVLNKWFTKNMFFELGTEMSAYLSDNKSNIIAPSPVNEAKYKQRSYSAAVNIGIGNGRLENVMDMQNALWLYKALQHENKLSRSLSADELYDLGRTITKANNTRVLDARKRIQFALETTDSFFRDKELISVNDIRYFSTLNDILFYAINNLRYSGTEKYIRLRPSINSQFYNNDNKTPSYSSENRSTVKSARLSAGINKYVPTSLTHQNNYGFSVYLNYSDWQMTDKYFVSGVLTTTQEINSTLKQGGINLFFQHAIYPNTRTVINFDLQAEGGYEYIGDESAFFGRTSLSGLLNYFISYKTILTGGLGISYQKNMYNTSQNFSLLPETFLLNANIGLQVSL